MKAERKVLEDGTVDIRFDEDPLEVGEGEDANEESSEIQALEVDNEAGQISDHRRGEGGRES